MTDSSMISAIICTRDRSEDLARCLPTVLANDHPNFEVVVIDQSDTDATKRVVQEAVAAAQTTGRSWRLVDAASLNNGSASEAGDRATRLIYRRMTDRVGLSLARNEGVRLSRGETLAFTDDDCTVPSDWLQRITVELENEEPGTALMFGAVRAAPHDSSKTFLPAFRPRRYRKLRGWTGRLSCHALAGANMAARRALFDDIGGFDECLGAGCQFRSGEDDDIAYRALRAGFATVINPSYAVTHWGERSYADGAARKLLRNHFFGAGAFMMKHLRCGDPLAAWMLVRRTFAETRYLVSSLVLQRRASGAGRLAAMGLGLFRGFFHPINRGRRIYAIPPDRPH